MKKKIKPAGFTLVELLCVVIIISVFIGLSVPALAKTANFFYFNNKVKQIQAVFWNLRKVAILEEIKYKLIIDFDQSSFFVYMQDNDNEINNYKLINDNLYSGFRHMKNIKLSSVASGKESAEVFFLPSGELTAFELKIEHPRGFRAKLLTSTSGEIKTEIL